jgi:hypothetical protein
MTAKRTNFVAGLLIAGLISGSCVCSADARAPNDLTAAEYRAELDRLLAATQELESSERETPPVLRDLPQSWRVRTEHQDFEISAEGLRQDVRRYEQERDVTNASAIRSEIQNLHNDLDGFERSPQDVTSSRELLSTILARPEFRDVRGPTFLDRLSQRLLAIIIRLMELLFRSSAIPTVSKLFVYGLIGLAVCMLGFLVYRQIKSASAQEGVVPTDLPISAKNSALWLAEARAAAAENNWREAIHLAYWAGISLLEQQGAWPPDRARTPREYLRLLPDSSEPRETLAALTRIFELAWYAKREADEGAFARTMQALERLGCHST